MAYSLVVSVLLLEITSKIHPCLQTLSYSASRTVLPSDFVDYAVVPSSAQVVVLTCGQKRRGREDLTLGVHVSISVMHLKNCFGCRQTWQRKLFFLLLLHILHTTIDQVQNDYQFPLCSPHVILFSRYLIRRCLTAPEVLLI